MSQKIPVLIFLTKKIVIFQCLSASVMLRMVSNNQPKTISKDIFKELCPSLIYQIEQDSCHSFHGDHTGFHGSHDGYHDHSDHDHGSHDHSSHAESVTVESNVTPKGMLQLYFQKNAPLHDKCYELCV